MSVDINKACQLLSGGAVGIIPTDTVYGLAMALQKDANPSCLYDIKNRSNLKPIAILIPSIDYLVKYSANLDARVLKIANTFWPGALTIIVNASKNVPKNFVASNGSIALRVPNNNIALKIMQKISMPLACTSANVSGQNPVVNFSHIDKQLLDHCDFAICDTQEKSGLSSTIIDCTGKDVALIRQGSISLDDINMAICNSKL